MKLRNLKGAIRKAAAVKFAMNGPMGVINATLVKSDLMAEFDRLHDGNGQAETGMWVSDNGFLQREADHASADHLTPEREAVEDPSLADQDDIDALLGGPDVDADIEDLLS